MLIPHSDKLPVHLLASCFNNTTATYKFYWFLSILHAVERGETRISKRMLFAGMVANAWYTVNYFSNGAFSLQKKNIDDGPVWKYC